MAANSFLSFVSILLLELSVTLKAQNEWIRNFRRIPVHPEAIQEDSGWAAADLHVWRFEFFSFGLSHSFLSLLQRPDMQQPNFPTRAVLPRPRAREASCRQLFRNFGMLTAGNQPIFILGQFFLVWFPLYPILVLQELCWNVKYPCQSSGHWGSTEISSGAKIVLAPARETPELFRMDICQAMFGWIFVR